MLFDNLEFHAMQSSLDALWLKQKAISTNIANYETPGYKAKQVRFEDALEKARGGQDTGPYSFKAVVTEDENTEVRPDGNNVDLDKESLELYNVYLQSAALYQKIGGQITNFRNVLSTAFK